MKKMAVVHDLADIPDFKTEAEEADYWGSHRLSAALLKQMTVFRLPPADLVEFMALRGTDKLIDYAMAHDLGDIWDYLEDVVLDELDDALARTSKGVLGEVEWERRQEIRQEALEGAQEGGNKPPPVAFKKSEEEMLGPDKSS